MARITPHIADGILSIPTMPEANSIPVESEAWWRWLESEEVTTFHFTHAEGSFTARRERKKGGWYWYAYRKYEGKLRKTYLGKSEELALARLKTAAGQLTRSTEEQLLYLDEHHVVPLNGSNGLAEMQLLATKLYQPSPRPDRVPRPHLILRLDASLHCSLTLISAPAGFGKTTLLSSWLASSQLPCAWLSLDASDNDPARFWAYAITTLQTLVPGIGEHLMPLLKASLVPSMEPILTVLINALTALPHDCLLVLDDYHLITEPRIHDALTFLLDHMPPRMHLVLLSRSDPPLPLTRLRVKGQLNELHAAELRFTFEEATTFLTHVMGLALAPGEIAALDAHTEGWIAGLQLAALSMQGHAHPGELIAAFTGSHRYILSYLTEEVLHHQPEPVRNFLLQTSILNRLSASLCNAVTGRDDAQAMLDYLEQANLFLVPLDEQHHWYRYHHLFAEFLRDRLQQTQPTLVPMLHISAATWFEQRELVNEAVTHLLTAGAMEQAARLVEVWAPPMSMRGEITTILNWVTALPEHEVRHRPYILIYMVGALTSIGRLDAAEAYFSTLEQELGDVKYASDDTVKAMAFAAYTALAAFRGDLSQTLMRSQRVREAVPGDDAYIRSILAASLGSVYLFNGELEKADEAFTEGIAMGQAVQNQHVVLACMAGQGYMQASFGHLHRAAETCRQAIRLGKEQDGKLLPSVSMAYGFLAEVLCEWDEIDEAERYLLDSIDLVKQWGYLGAFGQAYCILAHIYLIRGQKDTAVAMAQLAENFIQQSDMTNLTTLIVSYRAWIQLKVGDIAAAVQWARTCGLSEHDTFTFPREQEHLVLLEILVVQGHYTRAQLLIDNLLPIAEEGGRTRTVLMCLVSQALLLYRQGQYDAALASFTRALLVGEGEGFIRSIVDYGGPIALWLHQVISHGVSPTYVQKLLAALGQTLVEPGVHGSGLLSERETRVLQLIAAGRSNQEIAQDLVVAQSTVKTHINNIYAKLGVHSRTRAVARAKDLGLQL